MTRVVAPPVPSLVAELAGPLSVRLRFSRTDSIEIQRATGRFSQTWRSLTTLSSGTTYVDDDLTVGQYYRYRARAFKVIDGVTAGGVTRKYSLFAPAVEMRTVGLRADYQAPGPDPRRAMPRRKWELRDPEADETYVFDRNPATASSPWAARQVEWSRARYGRRGEEVSYFTGIRAGRAPLRWDLTGVMHSRHQHDAFMRFHRRGNKVHITTDLGEVHVGRIVAYSASEQGGWRNREKLRWEMTVLLYDHIPDN